MAIEWMIESGSAFAPARALDETGRLLELILGAPADEVRVEGDADDRVTPVFEFVVGIRYGDAVGKLELSSQWQENEDGSTDDSEILAWVSAYRTQLSVIAALVTAVAVTGVCGGELSGSSVGRLDAGRLGELVERLCTTAGHLPAERGSVNAPVSSLATFLGIAHLPWA